MLNHPGWFPIHGELHRLHACYSTLYQGLQHLRILVSKRILEPISCRYRGTTIYPEAFTLGQPIVIVKVIGTSLLPLLQTSKGMEVPLPKVSVPEKPPLHSHTHVPFWLPRKPLLLEDPSQAPPLAGSHTSLVSWPLLSPSSTSGSWELNSRLSRPSRSTEVWP